MAGLFDVLKEAPILGVYIYQNEGKIVFANNAFLSFIGYEEEDIIGRKLQDLLVGKEKEIALKNIKRRLKGEHFPFEYTTIYYKTKIGTLKPTLNFSYTIDYKGKPAGLVIFIDISKQKTYEVLFRSLSEINQLIVRCKDKNELLHSICDILVNSIGFKLAIIGEIDIQRKRFNIKYLNGQKSVVEYFNNVSYYIQDALRSNKGTISGAYKDKKITYSSNVYEDPNLEDWVDDFKKNGIYSIASVPIFQNGELVYILTIYSDTINRFSGEYLHILKELQLDVSFALNKLERQKELILFNKAIINSSNWVIITDKEGRIIKASSAVESISGYSLNEIIGKKPNIFKSGYHNDEFYINLWKNIKDGKQEHYHFVNRAKDGSVFYLDSIIIPIVVQGELYRIIAIARDVTIQIMQKRKIERLSSLYQVISDVNMLLLKSKTEDNILETLPKIILDDLHCKMVFTVESQSNGKYIVKSSVAENDYYKDYLKDFLTDDMQSIYKTPFFKSIQNQRVYVENNVRANKDLSIFHRQSDRYGFYSCFSMPVIKQKKTIGALIGFIDEINVFDEEISSLLGKVQNNISYALDKLEMQKWFNIMSHAVNVGFDFVVIVDSDFNIVYVNEKTEEISGYSKSELIGKHHSVFSSKIYNNQFISDFYSTLSSGKIFSGLMMYRTKDSKIIKAIVNIMPFKVKDKIEYYIAVGKDITKEIHLQTTLKEILNHDSVTGLINRTAFLSSIDRFLERARHEKELASVAIINPIDFASVNRAFGFETGNRVLNKIADRIKSLLREYDVVAKLESDKFAVLLKDIKSEDNALWIFVKLIEALSKPYLIDENKISLYFNIGISLYPKDDVKSKGLLEKAMIALIDAKNKGEGFLGFYKAEFEKDAMRKIELRNSIKDAINKNEFILHYQPYFDAKNKKLVGAEALIRWQKDGKIIPPLEFIPFLEKTKMISSIERWVVESVSKSIKKWNLKGLRVVPISINISPASFSNLQFAKNIIRIIKKHGIKETLINIEIIERLLLNNMEYTKSTIHTLKRYGLSFSIDDFGTGYSSLSYLAKLSIDYVKIDISFIREMLTNNNTQAIVETIVYLSKRLQMKTIAEGVEKMEQFEFLKSIECDFIQGYLFSKPLPEDEFEKILKQYTNVH